MQRRSAFAVVAVVALVAAGLLVPTGAAAAPVAACENRNNNTVKKLLECVTLEGVREHQAALQEIADENGGNRFSGFPGYDESVDYFVERLEAAGYDPVVQAFDYLAFFVQGPSTLEQVAPNPTVYVEEVDYSLMDQTDPGDVTASVTAVDLQLGLGNSSTSGCEAGDFAGFPAGNIALLQRGACTFQAKAENAAAAGAVGAIIFNQGDTPDRTGLLFGTLSAANQAGIPVVGTTYDLGVEWSETPGLVMHIVADTVREVRETYNVLADLPGRTDNVVVVGGHLDSVAAGPGINDNGSGVGAILEVAEQMRKVKPHNTVRFAFWGAEESGLVGSDFYVFGLPEEELERIVLYLNFDMVGSPNYVRFVYDGDGSAFGLAGPPGSGPIEDLFAGFYDARGLESEETEISFRSDYAAFFDVGVPFGGLFTGAEGIKTPEQQAVYGGTAGEQYDPCYHQACDTFDNVALDVLDLNSDAIAFATLTYAKDTSSVTGP